MFKHIDLATPIELRNWCETHATVLRDAIRKELDQDVLNGKAAQIIEWLGGSARLVLPSSQVEQFQFDGLALFELALSARALSCCLDLLDTCIRACDQAASIESAFDHRRVVRVPRPRERHGLTSLASAYDHRRLSPVKLVQLMNSNPTLGTVVTLDRLRQHQLEAGFRISADGETVDFLKYTGWLVARRHARLAAAEQNPAPGGGGGAKTPAVQPGGATASEAAAGIDWNDLLLSPPLSAAEVAEKLEQPVDLVERTLRNFRNQHDFGFIEVDGAGIGEARFRYKMYDVLAHIQKWYVKRQKKAAGTKKPAAG